MKKFNSAELILLMFAFSVCLVIIISVGGIVLKGSSNPTDGAVAIRTALLDLLKIITGGVLGAVAASKSIKEDK